jgi:hypothetical protein
MWSYTVSGRSDRAEIFTVRALHREADDGCAPLVCDVFELQLRFLTKSHW